MSSEPEVEVRVPGSPTFRLRLHEKEDRYISQELRQNAIWEPLESSLVLDHLAPDAVFLDLGANIGYYTVLAAPACCTVVAFEPEPGNFALLQHNLAINGITNAEPVRAAAGRASGEASLFLSDVNQGDHRLYRNEERAEAVTVRTFALDDWFRNRDPRIDLVKMDTQGSEVGILEGMSALLGENQRRMSLILEYWPFGLRGAGDSAERLVEILAAYDFAASTIDEWTRLVRPVSWQQLLDDARGRLHPDTQHFTNLLVRPVS